MYFSIQKPLAEEIPVVVEVPHAGVWVDPASLATLIAPARSIGRDADLFVDELFADAPRAGATLLRAHVSRYVCDLNRSSSDVDMETSPTGRLRNAPHGLIWNRTTEGRPALAAPLAAQEVHRRVAEIYLPYHATLKSLLDEKVSKFGFAVLICGHSMPSCGRLGERRADIVPGSRGRSTAHPDLIDTPDRVAADYAFRVEHDSPYRGGYSTSEYGRPERGIHALQIELNRAIYMDEARLTRLEPGFSNCRSFCRALVEAAGKLNLAANSSQKGAFSA